jgi:hypothetical protein
MIEIEGDVSAEFLALDRGTQLGAYIAFSDGTILNVFYDTAWRILPVAIAKDTDYFKEYEAIDGSPHAYSDVVRLSSSYGFKWVILGKEFSSQQAVRQFELPKGYES